MSLQRYALPLLLETGHKNLTDPTHFAITGRDKKSGKFITLSLYLLRHPALNGNHIRILCELMAGVKDFDSLNDKEGAYTETGQEELRMLVGDSTVRDGLAYLKKLGLVEDRAEGFVGTKAEYYLMPGPWPMLGDRPEKHSRWQDWSGEPKKLFKAWKKYVIDPGLEVTPGLVETFAELFNLKGKSVHKLEEGEILSLLRTPKKKTEDKMQPVLRVSKKVEMEDTNPVENHRGEEPIGENHRGENQRRDEEYEKIGKTLELPSRTKKSTDEPRARADSYNNISITGTKRTSADADGSDFEKVTSDSNLPHPGNSFSDFSDSNLGKCETAANEKSENALIKAQQAEARERAARLKNYKPKKNTPRTEFIERYKFLVITKFHYEAPGFSAANERAFKNAAARYGAGNLIKALDWCFKHWDDIQNEGLYQSHMFPPVTLFFSINLMNQYMPFIKAEEGFPTKTKGKKAPEGSLQVDWDAHTNKQLIASRKEETDYSDFIRNRKKEGKI